MNVLTVVLASAGATLLLDSWTGAQAFVMPGQNTAQPRSHTDVTTFKSFKADVGVSQTQAASMSSTGILTMAATVGLAFGLLTATPVYAEDEASEPTTRAARKARREAARQAEKQAEKKSSSSESGGFSLPSFNLFESTGEAPKATPTVKLADDDKSPVASDPVALFLIFFTLPTIYLVFYVLGSIDVI
eukprot:CAMPEP_0178411484 /NCGR_PEP_ID=MMETSP0689_2-20121128/21517_1 /TAXON_ID=160604 /ORGANISM="Amphidinium massartii, Strain CS-259" /LENGTH=188 /DNA_ID=CAMNT_0020032689 /DNA_START=104 /DNA_END=670 /DNA_ORIENTATION=+